MGSILILAAIFLVIAVIAACTIGLGAAIIIIMFGDFIVCIAIIVWLISKLFRRKK